MPDVGRIDVARGPFSALYGPLAQTGVINYSTKIPDSLDVNASASYGDWNTRYFSFRIGDKPFAPSEDGAAPSRMGAILGENFFYSFSFKSRSTDGYTTTPSFRSLTIPVEGALDPDTPIVSGWQTDIDPQTGSQRYKIGDQGNNWYEDYGLFVKTGFDFSRHTRVCYSLNVSEFEYGWENGRSDLTDTSGNSVYDGDVYIQDGGNTYALTLSDSLFTSDPKKKESYDPYPEFPPFDS